MGRADITSCGSESADAEFNDRVRVYVSDSEDFLEGYVYLKDTYADPATRELAQAAGLTPADPAEVGLDKLEALLTDIGDDGDVSAPLLAALLGLAI